MISEALLKVGSHCALSKPNKKNVFGDCVKRLYDKSGCLRSVGRSFQTRGPAALKALLPKLLSTPTDEKRIRVSAVSMKTKFVANMTTETYAVELHA